MSQRFTVSASSRSDGELGEINQLFEGDEPNPSSSDKEGASDLTEDPAKANIDRMRKSFVLLAIQALNHVFRSFCRIDIEHECLPSFGIGIGKFIILYIFILVDAPTSTVFFFFAAPDKFILQKRVSLRGKGCKKEKTSPHCPYTLYIFPMHPI